MLNQILLLLPQALREEAHPELPVVHTHGVAAESTYTIAKVIMSAVEWILDLFGLGSHDSLFTFIYAAVVFLIAFAIGQIVKIIVVFVADHLSKVVKSDLYMGMRDSHLFTKICRIIPPLVFLIFIQFTLVYKATLAMWLTRLTWIYIIYIVADSLCILANVIWDHVDSRENKKKLPLKGLVQLVKGIVWIIAVIIIVGILIDKSPASLLAGLGAFAAVLMLVFKDSILGVVAGVQLSENDSLHVGDWIKVPGTDANGNVIEVSLTSVKVENFDKTVTTLPPYSLISGSFTNYRPMQLSGTRRILRCYMIDSDSVLPASSEMLAAYARIPLLSDWISKKIAQKEAGKVEDINNSDGLVDGSIDTNLGVFRAYLKLWLDANPHISHSDTCFISTLAQTPNGIPLQVYCFTSTSQWLPYEAIQSKVFETIATMLGSFHLYTYENASGRDEVLNGVLEYGANPELFFGVPYPFMQKGGTPDSPARDYPADPRAPLSDTPSGANSPDTGKSK